MSRPQPHHVSIVRRFSRALALPAIACGMIGCATPHPDYNHQQVFSRPEQAATSLATAVRARDTAAIEALFGPEAKDVVSSGDPVADRNGREVFAAAMAERWTLERIDGNTKELVIGHEAWPFPIPLVRDSRGWWFDTAAGRHELLARRIGRNELTIIGAMHAVVLAQREYASVGRDGAPAGAYAQQFRSDPGRHNGLYWAQESPTDPTSPIGLFAAEAAAEGYGSNAADSPAPFHGYFFHVLKKQGPDAAGGAAEYVVNGRMTGGFGLIAYPAKYGNSGIMSFLVGKDGVVYEADLGPDSLNVGRGIDSYNPGSAWKPID